MKVIKFFWLCYIETFLDKSCRRPDDHCFEAVKLLLNTYELEDRFLFYSYCNSAALPNIMKSIRLKLQFLQNFDVDGKQRLSKDTVYLDVLHNRSGFCLIFEYTVL